MTQPCPPFHGRGKGGSERPQRLPDSPVDSIPESLSRPTPFPLLTACPLQLPKRHSINRRPPQGAWAESLSFGLSNTCSPLASQHTSSLAGGHPARRQQALVWLPSWRRLALPLQQAGSPPLGW
ncbi:hypothetical protein HJG60_011397 [Phyllostomus discolor]|uniref:Uncharacterized protein n=1 Tax=Phyllostomus discolor TaxID=89673 RepID=A0A834A7V5_9CHIR|nr:hypothetical protein HJG60_011397 [Phyllostomus discolor]